MKKLFLLLAVAMLASCSQVQEGDVNAAVGAGTTISVDLPQTRTSLGSKNENGNYSVYWSAEDKLVANGSPSTKITIKEDGSSAQFEFGLIGGGLPYNLTYPYTEGSLCAEGQPTVVFAAEQNYTEGTFGVGYAPMCGYNEGLGTTVLKHLAGVLRISPYGAVTLSKIEIIAAEGVALAGEFDVDCQTGAITAIEGKTSNKITYTINKALTTDASTAEPFFITVPAGELGQCQVILTDNRNLQMTLNWNGKSVVAGVVREFKPFEFKVGASFELGGLTAEDDELVIEEPTEVTPTEPASNEIWYTATAKVVPYKTDVFGANIESNEWDEATGEGVITFDGEVTSLGDMCFYYNTNLIDITIPSSVLLIGNSAFESCSNLNEISISPSIQSIGMYAFAYCNKLKAVTFNEGLLSIGNGAFNGCSSLLDITIPSNITTISRELFYGCTALTNITFPKQLRSIGTWAFYNCSNLKSITIPASLTFIDTNAFERAGIRNIYIEDLYSWFNITFANQFANPISYGKLYYNGELLEDIVIPNSIKEIKNYALYSLQSVKKITIPSSVTKIGTEAFSNCYYISEIYCKSAYPPLISDSNIFGSFYSYKGAIYVPASDDDSIINAYKSANVWSNYATYMEEYNFTE